MNFEDRVRALMSLGFSERQTRFLVTVALHSGFCLRRHYAAFSGLQYGQGVRDVLDRLVRRRLADRVRFRSDRGHVYHLYASTIYHAIGQDDNRNRRYTSPGLIARKLMLLDYVLTDSSGDWYATEQDKVDLFTGRFGIPYTDLPQRTYAGRHAPGGATVRYFIHKLPIRLDGAGTVSFVVLLTEATERAFLQFLKDHARLVHHLPRWRIVAVCPNGVSDLAKCQAAFDQFRATFGRPPARQEQVDLRTYFRTRAVYERGEIARLSVAEIDAFRAARRQFGAPAFESLYRVWQRDGDTALEHPPTPRSAVAPFGELVPYALPNRYEHFGMLAGIC